jgi:hypothetical protein
MADVLNYLRRPRDEDEYLDWLLGRQEEVTNQPHWLEVSRGSEEEFAPEAPPMRQVTAQRGDNISKLLGTSDPGAVGAFARVNGLKRGESTIYAGHDYLLSAESDAARADRGEGLLMMRRDNARLAEREAQRARDEASRRAQAMALDLAFDRDRYGPLGRLWFGSPTPLKVTAGGAAAAPGLLSYGLTQGDE